MIRRLLLIGALAFGLVVASASSANAGSVVCAYTLDPLNVGVCVGI